MLQPNITHDLDTASSLTFASGIQLEALTTSLRQHKAAAKLCRDEQSYSADEVHKALDMATDALRSHRYVAERKIQEYKDLKQTSSDNFQVLRQELEAATVERQTAQLKSQHRVRHAFKGTSIAGRLLCNLKGIMANPSVADNSRLLLECLGKLFFTQ